MYEGREYLVSNEKTLKLDIPVPYHEMYQEALRLRKRFVSYKEDAKWFSLPIIGLSSTQPFSWEVYKYSSAKAAAHDMQWTEISKECPTTTSWLKTIYPSNSYARVRFMLLEAGGVIPFHSDTPHSILGAANIALNNPDGCKWHWRDGSNLQFSPGDVRLMNISYEHSIRNDSREDRYHLIVHHYDSLDEWKNLVIKSMKEHNVEGHFCYSTELF